MFSHWHRRQHRQQLLATQFPTEWEEILHQNVAHFRELNETEREKLRGDVRILVAEKNWEGCYGLMMTDEVKVTIAGLASVLLLGFEDQYFDLVQSILVYPDSYVTKGHTVLPGGIVLEGDSHREGEAWYRGPVILSWEDTLAGGRGQSGANNLVLHEFAHQLDMENGRGSDGIPTLKSKEQYTRWQTVTDREFENLQHACFNGFPTLIDCYGTTNRAEFFAVCTECFFERPNRMRQQHSDLYEILSEYYQQDPAHRCAL